MKKPVMQVRGIADFAERVTGESGESWWSTVAKADSKLLRTMNVHKEQKFNVVCEVQELREYEKPKITEATWRILVSFQGFRGKDVNLATTKQVVI